MPIPATKEYPHRVDYEYERAGTASIFIFCEPLSGRRQVPVRELRLKIEINTREHFTVLGIKGTFKGGSGARPILFVALRYSARFSAVFGPTPQGTTKVSE